jgi:3-hydroxyacyl-[acyl-carrier-protein] dehydratase
MELKEILQRLPHAFPFRVIDRILHIEPGKAATTLKNVTMNEPFLQGHFPGQPVMPAAFILEAMAQTGGIAFHSLSETDEGGLPYLARVERFRLKKRVVPGDQMVLTAEIEHVFSNLAKVKVSVQVDQEAVAKGVLVLAKGPLIDKG